MMRKQKIESDPFSENHILVALAFFISQSGAYADRLPLQPQKKVPPYSEAATLPLSKMSKSELATSEYVNPKHKFVLTFDKNNEMYTYWYTDQQGKRQSTTFDQPSKVKVSVKARVETNADRSLFTYHYKVIPAKNNQQLLRFMLHELPARMVEKIETDKAWMGRASTVPDVNRVMISFRPTSFEDLKKTREFGYRIISKNPPRLSYVHAFGHHKHAAFPRGMKANRYATGLLGNTAMGITVGPGEQPLDAPIEVLKETLNMAGKWGWIGISLHKELLRKVENAGQNGHTITQLLDEIDAKAGRQSSEVHAMIEEIRHHL